MQAFAIQNQLGRVEIHCDPENLGSRGVPRRLGYALQVTLRNCFTALGAGPRDSEVWTLTSAGCRVRFSTESTSRSS